MIAAPPVDRRRFLILSSTGLLLAACPAASKAAAADDPLVQRFLAIGADGIITVFSKHLDMGQGIGSGLASIIAEELDADWSHVRFVDAPAKIPDYAHTALGVQTTGGSSSTAYSWDQLRQAGAVARAMLVTAAAQQWGVDPQSITITSGVIRCGSRQGGFGDFAAAAARLPVPTDARPKSSSDYHLLGRATPRIDIPDKTRGKTRYGIDTDWDGIKTVVVAHAPRFGAILADYDDSAARGLPGVVAILRIPSGVAVIAETGWHAMRARAALVTRWDETHVETRSTDRILADFDLQRLEQPPTAAEEHGDPAKFLGGDTARVVEARFEFPYLAHAALEPVSVAGRMLDGKCYLRGGFQSQTDNQKTVASILGIPIEKVFLETVAAGGSFGRRAALGPDWIDEFAHVLRASGGRWPLKLLWSRDDDIAGGRYRPLNLHHLRAALGPDGALLAVEQTIVGQSLMPPPPGAPPPSSPDAGVVTGHFAEQYACANHRLAWWNPEAGVLPHTYRGVSDNHNCVAKEVFVDRLARTTGADPVAFRLALLAADPRQQAVLRLAADGIGWQVPPAPGVTRGVAVHRANNSIVAQIVELTGSPEDFRIERVVAAVDCGRILNPDIVRAQVEGGIGFGLSSILYQQIRMDETGRVIERNYHNYRLLRMPEMPRTIDVHFVTSQEKPTGIGEPGSLPVMAALVNALERMGHPPIHRFPVIGARI